MEEVITAIDDALKAALRRYAEVLTPSLITIGKTALGTPGKVMHWRAQTDAGVAAPKPIWPLFVISAYKAALPAHERHTWREALSAAIAIEIMVAATDVIDEWSDGDPSFVIEKYGAGQALNAANLMLVMSQQVLLWAAQEGNMPALQALGALQDLLVEAAVGQHLDMLYEGMGLDEVTPQMSGEMSDRKAGALMSGALKMGGLMAGASDEIVELLARYGKRLGGIAQIANDMRDVLPQESDEADDMATTRPKTDIQRRKRTLPIVYTLREESEEPNLLQKAFSAPYSGDEDEDSLRQAIVDAGGIDFATRVLDLYQNDAAEILAQLEALSPGAREELALFSGAG
ncbi:MAG TPA: polyprenyl synthetase family protein [Chloroflexia bacterium]|nr:polyprenyl synthetase family protein [Chloroflexia bacterium]